MAEYEIRLSADTAKRIAEHLKKIRGVEKVVTRHHGSRLCLDFWYKKDDELRCIRIEKDALVELDTSPGAESIRLIGAENDPLDRPAGRGLRFLQ